MEKDCNNCKFELYNSDEIPCKDCGMDDREYWQPKPQTNADRIRAMSDDKLADFLHEKPWLCESYRLCNECPKYHEEKGCLTTEEWLQQPAREE